jgi:hypothetical protein
MRELKALTGYEGDIAPDYNYYMISMSGLANSLTHPSYVEPEKFPRIQEWGSQTFFEWFPEHKVVEQSVLEGDYPDIKRQLHKLERIRRLIILYFACQKRGFLSPLTVDMRN